MILPLTYTGALVCLAFSMLFLGSWPNFLRLAGKWRYELFFWDFSLGILLTALLAAFTLGSLNSNELTYRDNLLIASWHNIGYGLSAGLVVNLANLLLLGALSVAPISVVYPVGLGVAAVIGMAWTLFPAQGGVLLPLAGAVALLAAVTVTAFAYSIYEQTNREPQKRLTPDPGSQRFKATAPPSPAKGITLSVLGGIALGMAAPLLATCRSGEDGLAAYSAALQMAIAIAVSALVFSPFYMALPVQGAPVQLRAYFIGSRKQHLCGLLAGGLWMCGLLANFASGGTLANVQAGAVATRAFTGGALVLGTVWGLVAWREFRGSTSQVRILLTAMLLLLVAGAAMLVLAVNTAA